MNRRNFLKRSAATLGAVALPLSAKSAPPNKKQPPKSKVEGKSALPTIKYKGWDVELTTNETPVYKGAEYLVYSGWRHPELPNLETYHYANLYVTKKHYSRLEFLEMAYKAVMRDVRRRVI